MSQAVERRHETMMPSSANPNNLTGTPQPPTSILSPFYIPPDRKTSAQIIREARASLGGGAGGGVGVGGTSPVLSGVGVPRLGVRTVHTKRPFTPRERERTLFGGRGASAGAGRDERPPSSFTLSPLHFDTSDNNSNNNNNNSSRPGGSAGPRLLVPIASARLPVDDGDKTKLPALISATSRRVQRHQFRALSLCDLPEEDAEEGGEEGPRTPLRNAGGTLPRSSTFNALMTLNQSHQSIEEEEEATTTTTNNNNNNTQQEDANMGAPLPPGRGLSLGAKVSGRLQYSERRKSLSKRPGVDRDWRHAKDGAKEGEGGDSDVTEGVLGGGEGPAVPPAPPREVAVDQAVYYEEKVAPILDEIIRAQGCAVDEEVLGELVNKLYGCLEAGGLLGRHFRYRSQVLRAVFRLVDRENGALLAAIARVMLALKVSGSNLTSVCKLVFKVTRHDANDSLFLEGNLLDLLLEAVACVPPLEQPEACVYGYGALKFLTMNSQLVSRLLNRGILELLVLHMKLIVNHQQETGSVPEQTHYALVQLTGTLRHVSSCERTFPLLLVTGAVPQVCSLLHHFSHDQDVTANVVRILSIISTHEECCAAAASHPSMLPAAVGALKKHAASPGIVVRLAYALGNMMANSDEARWKLFSEDGFTESLLELLTDYLQRDRHHQAQEMVDPLTPASGTPEDVMVKLIRVLANVSVHSRVGPVLARSRTCLSLLVSALQHKGVDESEELVLSTLATLNNLTFYTRDQPISALHVDLAECLCEMLPMDHVEGLVETIRVFGNLTHFKDIRDILTKRAVLEVLVEMLDCDSRELVYVCAGVLVNLMSDASRRSIFQAENGVLRLIDVLQYFGYGDWQLCSLVCQVLWNFCASAADVEEVLGPKETEKLIYVLEEFLDDDSYFNNPEVFGECDPDTKEVVYQLWEDFAFVATKLLDRIEENTTALPVV
ncbi:armadillo repeat-containing protein 2-like isoform X2 [Eriocheir sinensis]|uniref:armadillo repeat-containing protein 2-like isoform X2 n=1 Tax=Eriocheir sinensis TaxID=95602 RepID=UPI0021CAC7DC|nr:armadillo repeat-containing protein 2-like isoform X2 [Eriocheir sinensis]